MSNMFLTEEQLLELTGLKQSAARIRWLRKNGVEHYVRADGAPRVPSSAIGQGAAERAQVEEPNFEALR